MKLKTCVFLIFLCILVDHLSHAQTSISSTDWEFQQIENSVREKENRVKALIQEVLVKVNAVIAELKSNGALSYTNTALESVRQYLVSLGTVASYENNTATLACDNIAVKTFNIKFDIEKCVKIKIQVDVNATLLFIEAGKLKNGYVLNYFTLTDAQRQSVWSIFTSLLIVFDEYNSYSVTQAMAVYKYTRLYVQLLTSKKTYCNCPTQLNSNSNTGFSTVDTALKQIQSTVDNRESSIRKTSVDALAKILEITPGLKKNSVFTSITTSLDSIATLVKGYQILTSTDTINTTTSCDEAAMKVGFLEYKLESYHQDSFEAAKNTSYVLNYLNNLKLYTVAANYYLSATEKQGITEVTTILTTLVTEYTQYVLALVVARVRLVAQLNDARAARSASCVCTETGGSVVTTQSK
jgi:hypothetical protein